MWQWQSLLVTLAPQRVLRSSHQRENRSRLRDTGEDGKADFLTSPKHGPPLPRRVSCILQPCAQVRVSHHQRQDGGSQARRVDNGGEDSCQHCPCGNQPHDEEDCVCEEQCKYMKTSSKDTTRPTRTKLTEGRCLVVVVVER